jgi:hypothetical protein
MPARAAQRRQECPRHTDDVIDKQPYGGEPQCGADIPVCPEVASEAANGIADDVVLHVPAPCSLRMRTGARGLRGVPGSA